MPLNPRSWRLAAILQLVLLLLIAIPAQGQTAFPYSGKLPGTLTAKYDLQFKLFSAAKAGAQIGSTLLRPSVQVTAGNYSVTLDFGPASLSSGPLFLEVGYRPVGTIPYKLVTTRDQITSVFSLVSASTMALQGVPVGPVAPAAGQVLKFNGTQWIPGADGLGQTYTAGAGLSLLDNVFSIANAGVVTAMLADGAVTSAKIAWPININKENPSPMLSIVNSGTGHAVDAISSKGAGLYAQGSNGPGIIATGYGDKAILATSESWDWTIFAQNTGSGLGVLGVSPNSIGVGGVSGGSTGVYGESTDGNAVHGRGQNGLGVFGQTTSGNPAIRGQNIGSGPGVQGTSGPGNGIEAYSIDGAGLYAASTNGKGLYATSQNNNAILAEASTKYSAVFGRNSGAGSGVIGTTTSQGNTVGVGGVGGVAQGYLGSGLYSIGAAGYILQDGQYFTFLKTGVAGYSQHDVGVSGGTTDGYGVYGFARGGGVGVSGSAAQFPNGFAFVGANLAGQNRFEVGTTSDDAGIVRILNDGGQPNVGISHITGAPSNGALGIFLGGVGRAGMFLNPDNNKAYVYGDVKSFRTPNPRIPATDIVYASVEGPEAAAYVRGTARLVNGRGVIYLPDHFIDVSNLNGMTVQITPLSEESRGLAVVQKSLHEGIIVRELVGGKGSYEFDYLVTCVRKGYENYQVIEPRIIAHPDGTFARARNQQDIDDAANPPSRNRKLPDPVRISAPQHVTGIAPSLSAGADSSQATAAALTVRPRSADRAANKTSKMR